MPSKKRSFFWLFTFQQSLNFLEANFCFFSNIEKIKIFSYRFQNLDQNWTASVTLSLTLWPKMKNTKTLSLHDNNSFDIRCMVQHKKEVHYESYVSNLEFFFNYNRNVVFKWTKMFAVILLQISHFLVWLKILFFLYIKDKEFFSFKRQQLKSKNNDETYFLKFWKIFVNFIFWSVIDSNFNFSFDWLLQLKVEQLNWSRKFLV